MDTQKIEFAFVCADGTRCDVSGQPGQTLMQVAFHNSIEQIAAECGGSMSCGTCHVYLDEASYGRVDPPTEGELDMLEIVSSERRATSRLSCQVTVSAALQGAVVQVPDSQF